MGEPDEPGYYWVRLHKDEVWDVVEVRVRQADEFGPTRLVFGTFGSTDKHPIEAWAGAEWVRLPPPSP